MFSCNHEDIGAIYFIFRIWSGTALLIILIRIELGQPGPFIADDQIYNTIATSLFVYDFFYSYNLWIRKLIHSFDNFWNSGLIYMRQTSQVISLIK